MDDPARGVGAEGVGVGIGGVDPGAAYAAAALEDDNVVALAAELAGSDEAGGASPDDGEAAAEGRAGQEGGAGGHGLAVDRA